MPMALEYGDRIRACLDACNDGAEPPRLLTEFQACQRLVASEAVYNSMVATVTAVGLGSPGGGGCFGQAFSRMLVGVPVAGFFPCASLCFQPLGGASSFRLLDAFRSPWPSVVGSAAICRLISCSCQRTGLLETACGLERRSFTAFIFAVFCVLGRG